MEKKNSLRGILMLLIGSAIWGSAFVAQNKGMEYIGPFTFNGIRFLIGALVLLPVVLIMDKVEKKRSGTQKTPDELRAGRISDIKAALICGAALFVPSTLQQIGLISTSPGKSGFITAMYIVAVPVLSLFLGKKAGLNVWLGVALAVAGLYLLCVTEQLTIAPSDTVTLVSVLFWGIQILVIDRYAERINCIKLAFMEFVVAGLLSLIPMFIFEKPQLDAIIDCAIPLLYVGIFSCGVAYTLQPAGQKYTTATVASLIMSLESVFSVITGYLILHDTLTARELTGCALMFAAVLLAQFSFGGKENDPMPCGE